jgi:protein involved in polysaccharide export with SLBB domain
MALSHRKKTSIMSTAKSNYRTPLHISVGCLLLAALTACSTTRSQYVWRDVGPQGRRETSPGSPLLQSWGADAEGPHILDPAIAPGFLLKLSSQTDKKLNGDMQVAFDGTLQLPYDIALNTSGLTLSELKKKLTTAYSPYFAKAPDIDIRVKERRYWVDVRGLIQKPGRYLVEANTSLDQVIALAGGTDKQIPPQFVRIQKGDKQFLLDMNQYYGVGEDQPQILGWLGGELIFLQKERVGSFGERSPASPYRLPIYMLGEVRKPGEYSLKPGADFADLLTQANGFTEGADLDHIELMRRTNGRKRSFEFSWNHLTRAPTPVQGDVILVHADRQSKSMYTIQVMALVASILTSAAIIYELNRTNNQNR